MIQYLFSLKFPNMCSQSFFKVFINLPLLHLKVLHSKSQRSNMQNGRWLQPIEWTRSQQEWREWQSVLSAFERKILICVKSKLSFKSCFWCEKLISKRYFKISLVEVELSVGPGSGLTLSKYFGPISDLHSKLFYNIRSNNFSISWHTFVVPTAALLWLKWLWFSSANSICKLSCVSLFSARVSLTLMLRRRQRWGNQDAARDEFCFEKINHLRNSWLVLRNDGRETGFPCLFSTILNSFR